MMKNAKNNTVDKELIFVSFERTKREEGGKKNRGARSRRAKLINALAGG